MTLCQILNIIAPYPLADWGWHSVRETHYVIEAERRAYADRNAYLGDPAFVKNPIAQLLEPRLRGAVARADRTRSAPRRHRRCKPGLHIDVHENGADDALLDRR